MKSKKAKSYLFVMIGGRKFRVRPTVDPRFRNLAGATNREVDPPEIIIYVGTGSRSDAVARFADCINALEEIDRKLLAEGDAVIRRIMQEGSA